ncbi:hypothetical protein F2Q70_00010708 [Brassica cretica]|uniref:Uncharacterized protein n=1 Tax=Brassica cretica TaxID=69181 RepID=A0A8S9LRS1_BRACR|nr:hypothetical protein F2Q68_00003813 [Brassica cretica]KAF2610720.1 hypothetical protein F2Q70_00010708 [Brassica cretica]
MKNRNKPKTRLLTGKDEGELITLWIKLAVKLPMLHSVMVLMTTILPLESDQSSIGSLSANGSSRCISVSSSSSPMVSSASTSPCRCRILQAQAPKKHL